MSQTFIDPDAGKSTEQLFAERSKRIMDAFQMKQPDRIPIMLGLGYLLADMGGVTRQELYENPAKSLEIQKKIALDFQPDTLFGLFSYPGASIALGDQMTKWPGHGLGPNGSFQFAEQEFMKPEDYDAFLDDTADWAIRTYLPRAFSTLKGFSALPPFQMLAFGHYYLTNLPAFAAPPIVEGLKAISKGIQATLEVNAGVMETIKAMAEIGFPFPAILTGALVEAPFDFMSDTLRGMRGIMVDIHRRPEKLLAAQEKVLRFELEFAVNLSKATGSPYAFLPLHRGSDGFMSLPQFEKFYWPQLKSLMVQLVDNGITPWCFYEGVWDQRLEYLAELPKGKTGGLFQSSDIFKVGEVLGDTMFIMGGMPNSLLQGGTVEQVRERTKQVCEKLGKGGGFVMTTGVLELEGSDPKLIKAWVDATKEFGVY
ncbi:MAG: hypothetical protein JW908_03065 [Anaerolineales bacterium]|nr:hypothetical protein [Anaerolineales bacterium]